MQVERLLQISLATLAALGSLLLAVGQYGNSILPMLATGAAFSSVYFTDIRGWIRLNRNIANLAALIAVMFSFVDFWEEPSTPATKLHAIAKLLIYLQIVLLFQPKTTRVYWHLAILSLLQVVVAAALNLSVTFGIMLIPYMFAALTTLSLFFIYREALRVDPQLRAAHDAIENRPIFPVFSRSSAAAGSSSAEGGPPMGIQLTGHLPANLAAVFTSGKMFGQVSRMGVFTLCVTVILFYLFPRIDQGRWSQSFGGAGGTTGFKDQISLNSMGEMLQNEQSVMRVRLVDPVTELPIEPQFEPYFRGTVLVSYIASNRTWISGNYGNARITKLESPPDGKKLYRQEVTTNRNLQFDRTNEGTLLFSIYPAYASEGTSRSIVDNQSLGILSYEESSPTLARQPQQYEMMVPWTGLGLESQLSPVREPMVGRYQRYVEQEMTKIPLNKDIADDLFDGIKQEARDILQRTEVDPADPYQVMKALERHFVIDGNYTYSLGVPHHLRNPRLDPIENFVVHHRTGHCEYFASALTIMLRAQDIPARIVVGYKGGEFNSVGKYVAVRQLHAHAWVEAYLPPEALPEPANSEEFPYGAWVRLDPTPASRPGSGLTNSGGMFAFAWDWFDYLEQGWRDYVVGMNRERQNEIYEPFSKRFLKPFEGWFDREQWGEWVRGKLASLGITIDEGFFSGYASLITMILLLSAAVCFELGRWALRRIWPRLKILWIKWFPNIPSGQGFYFKMEQILSKAGWTRKPSTTPQEFVDSLTERMTGTESAEAVPIMQRIVACYYGIRFGRQTLSDEQQRDLQMQLVAMQNILQRDDRTPSEVRGTGP